jgi:hypothetical protein
MRDYPDWNGENPAVEALRNELKHFERMAQNLRKGLVPINPRREYRHDPPRVSHGKS